MSDTLRDRIAEVIEETVCGYWENGYGVTVADAVIAELKLNTDRVGTLTRYVTEWKPHE